jgi:membrane peptidoglycan carboxypeptidase
MEDAFKEELKAIQQWFNVLSEQERTTALYSLVKSLNLDQIRFFMTVLQQMASKEMIGLGVSSSSGSAAPGGPGSSNGPQPGKSDSPKAARKSKSFWNIL